VGVGVSVLVEVGVGVTVTVGVTVIVGVKVMVGVTVTVGVTEEVWVDGGFPCRMICGFSQMAESLLFGPLALTTRMNFTVFPSRLLKSRSTG